MDGQVFELTDPIGDDAAAFFDENGFVRFGAVASPAEVAALNEALDDLNDSLIREGREAVNGIPLKRGTGPDSRPMIQRFAFTSLLSEQFSEFVHDTRFEAVRRFVGAEARLSERENDGVVVNQFCRNEDSKYSRLGWHTDSLRDLAYLRRPQPLIQVGLYLTDSHRDRGGLRVLAGTHNQRIHQYLFRKLYFLDNRADDREVCIEADAGDLTIHDGRLWHRVAEATTTGRASLRRVMYMPFITGPYAPKDETSATPFYHRLQRLVG